MAGTPDDWMDVDVGKMVLRTRERVDRLCRIKKKIDQYRNKGDHDMADQFEILAKNEIRMCHTIAVAVRARSKEVAEYMTNYLKLDNVEESMIKENPWMICAAAGAQWDRICMLLDAQDAANGL